MRIFFAVNLRFPGEGKSAQGESEPKARPKGVVDGQRVNIPVLARKRLTDGGTEPRKAAGGWKCLSTSEDGPQVNPGAEFRRRRELNGERSVWKGFQENLLGSFRRSVLKLTQVGEENILRRSGELWSRNSAK